jgi:hypothetical protein
VRRFVGADVLEARLDEFADAWATSSRISRTRSSGAPRVTAVSAREEADPIGAVRVVGANGEPVWSARVDADWRLADRLLPA